MRRGDRTVYIASGSPKDLAALQKAGVAASLLDDNTAGQPGTTGSAYYLVDASAENAAELAAAAGDVLFNGTTTLLVRTVYRTVNSPLSSS